MTIRINLELNIGGDVEHIKEVAQKIYDMSRDWPRMRDEVIEGGLEQIYMPEVRERTPKSTYERYGASYKNFPYFGQMEYNTEMYALGSGIDRTGWRIEVPAEYAEDVYIMPITANWSTPGTGPRWLDWAWENVSHRVMNYIEMYVEQEFADYLSGVGAVWE